MQRQWYFLYHSKTNAFWMCDTDVARIGDLRCRQCNAITEDNGLLLFCPCTRHRPHPLKYSFRNHKRAVGVRRTRHKISDREPCEATTPPGAWMANTLNIRRTLARGSLHRLVRCRCVHI